MKPTRLTIKNFVGARDVDVRSAAPLWLFAGMNGAGKTSSAEAFRSACIGSFERISFKKDADQLVTKGAGKTGSVVLETSAGTASFEVPSCKWGATLDLGGKGQFLPLVLWPERLPAMTPTDRRKWLFDLMAIKATAIIGKLERRGCNMVLFRKLDLKDGMDAASKVAANEATQAKGAWRQVTGETYGSSKAEGWAAQVPEFDQEAWDSLQELLAHGKKALHAATREVGSLEGQQREQAAAASRRAEKTTLAKQLPGWEDEFKELQDHADKLSDDLAAAGTALNTAKAALDVAKKAAQGAGKTPPSQMLKDARGILGGALQMVGNYPGISKGKVLVPWNEQEWVSKAADWTEDYDRQYTASEPVPIPREVQRAYDEAQARVNDLNQQAMNADNAVMSMRTKVEKARIAANDESQEAEAAVSEGDLQEARAKVQRLEESLEGLESQHQEMKGAKEAVDKAATRTKEAAEAHGLVKEWALLAEALGPNGVPAELLSDALDPINDCLRRVSELSGWSQVTIAADMAITVGGFLYDLVSESEKWRTQLALAIAVASLSGLKFVLADRVDVLDVDNRGALIGTLTDLFDDGMIEGAVCFGTFASRPSGLPAEWSVIWLENGREVIEREKAA